jgi:hypothetical protein
MLPPLGAQTLPGSRGDEFVRHRSCFNRRIERMRAYLEQISHSSHFLWHSGDVRKLRAGKVSRSDKFIQPESAAAGMGRWMAMFTGVIDLAKRSRSRP